MARRAPKIASALVLLAIGAAVFGKVLVPHDPLRIDPVKGELPPAVARGGSWNHPLGTDRKGRDILSRVVLGTRTALVVALGTIAIGGSIGTTLGLVAGYRDDWLGALIMRVVDGTLAFPSILIALVLAVTVGPGFSSVVAVLALVVWARYARVVRAEVLALREREFVLAARAVGASAYGIVCKHVLPNLLNSVVVLSTLQVGWAIVVEASLSFLGAGIPPPTPTWGGMVAEGRDFIETAWWISVCPGVAIMLMVLGFNLWGDWLRDELDPRLPG
jgi:peptide/nickel transport system permease protein